MGDTDRDDLRVRRCVGLRAVGPGLALAAGMVLLSTFCPASCGPSPGSDDRDARCRFHRQVSGPAAGTANQHGLLKPVTNFNRRGLSA